MDQSSLNALLNQLRGLDEDKPQDNEGPPSSSTAGKTEDAASSATRPRVHSPAEPTVDRPQLVDDAVLGAEQSELDRLLGSLRAAAPSTSLSWNSNESGGVVGAGSGYNDLPDRDDDTLSKIRQRELQQEAQHRDLRKLTFAQALPVISQLSADSDFIRALQEIKSDQESLELSLIDERNRQKSQFDKQLKAAQEAAVTTGTPYELDRVNKLMTSALHKFDKLALIRWDKMGLEQQVRLEQLGVPCFFPLTNPDPVAKQRQKRVMEVLVQLLEDG